MARRDAKTVARLVAIALATLVLASSFPHPVGPREASAHSAPSGASEKIMFGFPIESLSDAENGYAGQPPVKQRWVNVWAGHWIEKDGWGFIESSLKKANQTGHPLIIHWYYWGDSISRTNVSCNCTSRTVSEWETYARQLADRIRTYGGGNEIIVTLEMEFNKKGITDDGFASYFDYLLVRQNNIFHAVPNVKTVVAFGNWGYKSWPKFDDAVRASDYLGTQFLNSTVINAPRYKYAVNDTLTGVKELRRLFGPDTSFGKSKTIVYDWGLASYEDYKVHPYTQEWNIKYLETRLADFRAQGVFLFNFRAVKDAGDVCRPYHGCAEGYFGYVRFGQAKPAWNDVVGMINREYDRAVANQPPVARFTYTCDSQRACSFDATSSSDPEGPISSFAWNWGDGTSGSGSTASHTYSADGTYTVTLTVADGGGLKDSESKAVKVQGPAPNQPPTAEFTWLCDGLTCSFDGSSSFDPDGQVQTYSWDFGDGTSGSGASPTHTYPSAATYSVKLTVTDGGGLSDSETKSVPVTAPTTTPASLPKVVEAELFDKKYVGGNYTNASFSGGKGWNIWSNGRIEHTLRADVAGTYEIIIRAQGELVPGQPAPHMTLRINQALVSEWDVNTETLESYSVITTLSAGDHVFWINFTNDYCCTGGDKNLKVDLMDVHASNPLLPGSFEAETFTTRNSGRSYSNASFSGGAGWNLDQNGGIEQKVHNAGRANYTITIRAKGDLAGTEFPRMVLFANGVRVQEWSVDSESLKSYSVTQQFTAGDITFRVNFTNDACCTGGDRNLKLDIMYVNATRTALPAFFEAEAFTDRSSGVIYPSSGTNASFSGGKGWNLNTNGAIGQTYYNRQTQTYSVEVRAKEDQLLPEHAIMLLRIDGVIASEWEVVGETIASYTTTLTLSAGDHTLKLEFTNDDCCTQGDRNLKLDYIRFT